MKINIVESTKRNQGAAVEALVRKNLMQKIAVAVSEEKKKVAATLIVHKKLNEELGDIHHDAQAHHDVLTHAGYKTGTKHIAARSSNLSGTDTSHTYHHPDNNAAITVHQHSAPGAARPNRISWSSTHKNRKKQGFGSERYEKSGSDAASLKAHVTKLHEPTAIEKAYGHKTKPKVND